ncbi:hypothetical protein NWP21_09290 [Anabaenopsis sp. FSS-46]|uniref:hypothetical protein n=1 Tax=Anabaenopsis sp. FSS-46 TaxID=2971766 RepID=UPI002476B093|nr:hypothetical protein [Anabaenopsis sp. FSS-46]MDH6099033.1 hypothetical protein [Anabaenopsis sp. FSS-46]
MPRIFEIFGKPIATVEDKTIFYEAICPFTESQCDGGGNRNQTKIKLSDNHPLRDYFNGDLKSVIPAVCSIQYTADESPLQNCTQETWVVCPRRLLGFKNIAPAIPEVNRGLQPHEREVLNLANLPKDQEIGIWPEVYLQYGDNDTNSQVDYHFDFIVAPIIRDLSEEEFYIQHQIQEEQDKREIIKSARRSGVCHRIPGSKIRFDISPDLSHPIIFEVMTASTSGSNTEKGTDIASAFTAAMIGNDPISPGINKRQVWGRMATQLFAKSALAEAWGGETFWVVQDELLSNIEKTTQLSVGEIETASQENINFISMTYDSLGSNKPIIKIKQVYCNYSGISFTKNNAAVDILLPKALPHKKELLKSILRRNLAAIVRL